MQSSPSSVAIYFISPNKDVRGPRAFKYADFIDFQDGDHGEGHQQMEAI